MKKSMIIALMMALLVVGCDKDEDEKSFPMSAAVDFAGPYKNTNPDSGRFNYDAYMLREYQIACNPTINESGIVYSGTFEEWKTEPWEGDGGRASYLPPPYSFDINITNVQQYYELIGTRITQIGYGWIDTYDTTAYPGSFFGTEGHIWSVSGDDPMTIWFNGSSPFYDQYAELIRP